MRVGTACLAAAGVTVANIGVHVWFRQHHHGHHGGRHRKGGGKNGKKHRHNGDHHESDDPNRSLPTSAELLAFESFEAEHRAVGGPDAYDCEGAADISACDERIRAFGIFRENYRFVRAHNEKYAKGKETSKLALNRFADMSHSEEHQHTRFSLRKHLGLKIPDNFGSRKNRFNYLGMHQQVHRAGEGPTEVDWRKKNAVTPVKNQGACGSCWSFSTTGSLEGAWSIAHGKLVSISEQQFVDCDPVDHGCNGGLMDNAFAYAESHDLCTEESYHYDAEVEECKMPDDGPDGPGQAANCTIAIPKGSVVGFRDVLKGDPAQLKDALARQPVSVAIQADSKVFQFFKEGVITSDTCGANLNHGVLAVGYGTLHEDGNSTDYFLVKNSWGPQWGIDGYVRVGAQPLADDDDQVTGVCGILSFPSYPEIKKGSGVSALSMSSAVAAKNGGGTGSSSVQEVQEPAEGEAVYV